MPKNIRTVLCDDDVRLKCTHYQKMLAYEGGYGKGHLIMLISVIFSYMFVVGFLDGEDWVVTMAVLLISSIASILAVKAINFTSKLFKLINFLINFILLLACISVLFNVSEVIGENESAAIFLRTNTFWPHQFIIKLKSLWEIAYGTNVIIYLILSFIYLLPKKSRALTESIA